LAQLASTRQAKGEEVYDCDKKYFLIRVIREILGFLCSGFRLKLRDGRGGGCTEDLEVDIWREI